jgi:hypothetical protein
MFRHLGSLRARAQRSSWTRAATTSEYPRCPVTYSAPPKRHARVGADTARRTNRSAPAPAVDPAPQGPRSGRGRQRSNHRLTGRLDDPDRRHRLAPRSGFTAPRRRVAARGIHADREPDAVVPRLAVRSDGEAWSGSRNRPVPVLAGSVAGAALVPKHRRCRLRLPARQPIPRTARPEGSRSRPHPDLPHRPVGAQPGWPRRRRCRAGFHFREHTSLDARSGGARPAAPVCRRKVLQDIPARCCSSGRVPTAASVPTEQREGHVAVGVVEVRKQPKASCARSMRPSKQADGAASTRPAPPPRLRSARPSTAQGTWSGSSSDQGGGRLIRGPGS